MLFLSADVSASRLWKKTWEIHKDKETGSLTRKCSQTQTTAKETVSAEYKTHSSPSKKKMSLLQHKLLFGKTSKA